ncbi:hypothetical protein CSA37_08140 [Candidatus Fermentibacteria bacterium]|nr:MAG: hypothetical protein CSA37_08140 [Candidatus Fermentibacteria bacterium]
MILLILLCLLTLLTGCAVNTGGDGETADSYSASAVWRWQNTNDFVLRGRARLQGESRVFSGPFIVRASRKLQLIRADFCGPDGSPLLSILVDSLGSTVYAPDEGTAYRVPGGFPFGNAALSVNAIISLMRTGFPCVPVQREMMNAISEQEKSLWFFESGQGDSMTVSLESGALLPCIESEDISLSPVAASWHDRFHLWPLEWELVSENISVIMRIRSIDEFENLTEGSFQLIIPVPVDTFAVQMPLWSYSVLPPVR